MKIAHFTISYPRHSADTAGVYIKELVTELTGQATSGFVIVPWDYKSSQTEDFRSYKIIRFRYSLITKGYLAFGPGIMANIKANPVVLLQVPLMLIQFFLHGLRVVSKCDLLHAHWATTALPVCLLGFIFRKPVVVTLHNEDLKLLDKWWLAPLVVPTLLIASLVVCPNKAPLSRIGRRFPYLLNKLTCIHYGMVIPDLKLNDIEHFKRTKMCFRKGVTALFIGAINPSQKIELLISVVAKLEQLNLVLVGAIEDKDYFSKLIGMAEKLSCRERVFFEGAVEPDQIYYYLKASEFYFSASQSEERPLQVLNALALHIPVVLSDIPAHREFIDSGKNGILFNIEQTEKIIEQVKNLLNLADLRRSFIEAGISTVNRLTWAKCAEAYIEEYRKLSQI